MYRQEFLKRVSLKTDDIVHWKLKDMVTPAVGFVAGPDFGPAPGGVKRGPL